MASPGETEALREALAQCEGWGGDMASLFEPNESTATCRQRAARRSAPYPSRRKRELESLRAEITELEKAIQAVVRGRKSADPLINEWSCIASRQESEREKAENENDRLRTLLLTHERELSKVGRLLKRSEEIARVSRPQVSFTNFRGPEQDPQQHLLRLNELEARTEEVFATQGFTSGRTMRKVQFRELDPRRDGVELEYEICWSLPFSVDDVASALWVETSRMANNDKTIQFMHIYETNTDLVSLFISAPDHDDTTPLTEGQVATRRLPTSERDGSALLISNYVAHFFVEGLCGGILDSDEWILVEPVTPHLSRVKWYRRVKMDPPETSDLTSSELARWKHAIISSGKMRRKVENSVDRNIQRVENWLLTLANSRRENAMPRIVLDANT